MCQTKMFLLFTKSCLFLPLYLQFLPTRYIRCHQRAEKSTMLGNAEM